MDEDAKFKWGDLVVRAQAMALRKLREAGAVPMSKRELMCLELGAWATVEAVRREVNEWTEVQMDKADEKRAGDGSTGVSPHLGEGEESGTRGARPSV